MLKNHRLMIILIALLIIFAVWVALPQKPFLDIGRTVLGLDLVGGVQALLEADLPPETAVTAESMSTAATIVSNRVNGLAGVTEALVQQAGDRRIVVELPGETDPEKALSTIRKTGLLEFVDMSMIDQGTALTLENTQIQTDFATSGSDTTAPISPTTSVGTPQVFHTVMTGATLKNVGVTTNAAGGLEVAFELDSEGAKIFSDFTSAHIGGVLAIVLDKTVISVPTIQNAITDGQGVITGNFDEQSANQLALQLRYGSLPIPLRVATSQTVGPTLGQDSLNKSLIAGAIGLSVVILFMLFYYRLPGLLADLALVTYALLTFAIFKLIPVTLTLPGIAGFVLSIGVAVDANILIFERLREELRAGRSLVQAIDLGWSRAWPSIRDSNFSTLITCGILYWFGSTFGANVVKGFSVTLAIGVFVSMFTAIIVTRTFLHLVLDRINYQAHRALFGVTE